MTRSGKSNMGSCWVESGSFEDRRGELVSKYHLSAIMVQRDKTIREPIRVPDRSSQVTSDQEDEKYD